MRRIVSFEEQDHLANRADMVLRIHEEMEMAKKAKLFLSVFFFFALGGLPHLVHADALPQEIEISGSIN
jgi:hypothetical protein